MFLWVVWGWFQKILPLLDTYASKSANLSLKLVPLTLPSPPAYRQAGAEKRDGVRGLFLPNWTFL
jgi:hypothetical protein